MRSSRTPSCLHVKTLSLGAVLALVVLGLSVAAASAAQPDRPAVNVPGATVTEGLTHQEILDRGREMHEWLLKEIPQAALASPRRVQLTPEEHRSRERSVPSGPGPLKIGLVKTLTPAIEVSGLDRQAPVRVGAPFAGGVLEATDDGGFVWALPIVSEGAGAVRVRFSSLDLPAGANLYLMGLEGEAYGPYQGRGPDGTGDFWANTVLSSQAVVVLRYFGRPTAADLRQIRFVVPEVGHIGPRFPKAVEYTHLNFCGNPSCVEDAACFSLTGALANLPNAIAKMEWISGAFIFTCTGGLINDTNPNADNFFLTANHCLSSNNNAQNVNFFWFYRNNVCDDQTCPNDAGFPQTLGSTVSATGSSGDFTLLHLNVAPPGGSFKLGYLTTAVANSNGTALFRISNPNFGPQAYSEHSVDTGAPTCSGIPRGAWIYSRDTTGATDGGSSGSPVVNASAQIVGQLTGACGFNTGDPCDSVANATIDGALASYYASVQPFLEGGGGGCTPLGGSCTSNSQCCSNKCRGPNGGKTCR